MERSWGIEIFPGRNAGASLKWPAAPTPPRTLPIFPGRNAGASLKFGVLGGQSARGCVHLPRQKCRGLIEVCARGRVSRLYRCIFPGRNAGASLKLFLVLVGQRGHDDLPRQKCRGLIEVGLCGSTAAATAAIFPGRNAGASLKPNSPSGITLTDIWIFPGRNAGASLKPQLHLAPSPNDARSSPAEMPGPH